MQQLNKRSALLRTESEVVCPCVCVPCSFANLESLVTSSGTVQEVQRVYQHYQQQTPSSSKQQNVEIYGSTIGGGCGSGTFH